MHTSVEHGLVSGSRSNRILHFRTGSGLNWILKKLNRIKCGYPNCIDHCSKMVIIRGFFEYKPDWIKYLDRSTGLRSDRITQRKFWTGLGFQNSPIYSTLMYTRHGRDHGLIQCFPTNLGWRHATEGKYNLQYPVANA